MSKASVVSISTDWMGDVPERWATSKLTSIFFERNKTAPVENIHLTPSQKYGVLPQTEYTAKTGSQVVQNIHGQAAMKSVLPGDFISHLRSFQGGLELSKLKGKVSSAYTVIYTNSEHNEYFFKHLFKSKVFIQALQSTTDQLRDGQSIRMKELGLITVPVPDVQEQKQIAEFLDRETGQIDDLIAELERLISLLEERRTAVITQAVTKGLNPDAPMKDSGIEWLGQIPVHWEMKKVSWLFKQTASGTTPKQSDLFKFDEAEIPWVTSGELKENIITKSKFSIKKDSLSGYSALNMYEKGSLLIAMYGATIGRTAILGLEATSNQAVCALIGPINVTAEYMEYLLQSSKERLVLTSAGGGQPNISQDKIRNLKVPIPPMSEQTNILAHIERETSKIDTSIETAKEGIKLAKERREALISAAVTGKIDVRSVA